MCSRPSRSLNSTVTALMRFSSVRYFSRCSWILCGATRSLRCCFDCRFSSSSSSYGRERKLRSSVDMHLLELSVAQLNGTFSNPAVRDSGVRVSCGKSCRQIENGTALIDKIYRTHKQNLGKLHRNRGNGCIPASHPYGAKRGPFAAPTSNHPELLLARCL